MSPPQRAKIGQAPKTPEEKTTNATSKCDNNGSRDRMKLTDFNFLMVLGKGSFGKVGPARGPTRSLLVGRLRPRGGDSEVNDAPCRLR